MSSITTNTRLAQVPATLTEEKKQEAEFNQLMKKMEFELPMLEGVVTVLDSNIPEEAAKYVSKNLRQIRSLADIKKYLQKEIQNGQNEFENADKICAVNRIYKPAYQEPCSVRVPRRRENIIKEMEAKKAILRQFK